MRRRGNARDRFPRQRLRPWALAFVAAASGLDADVSPLVLTFPVASFCRFGNQWLPNSLRLLQRRRERPRPGFRDRDCGRGLALLFPRCFDADVWPVVLIFFRWLLKPRQFAGPAPQNAGLTALKGPSRRRTCTTARIERAEAQQRRSSGGTAANK
jgi:hypothetical protein